MSLCARCGMNEPLPTDPDDFCADCCAEVEAIVADIEERWRKAEYQRLEFACVGICTCGGNPKCPRCNP